MAKRAASQKPFTWTVMIYMAAGDSFDLDANAVRDLQEMQRAAIPKDVAVVVQINRAWPSVPQRYQVTDEGSRLFDANRPMTNMGAKETLLQFIDRARRQFPAKGYFLILWGHAYGLGFGRDHGDPLTLDDLRWALTAFEARRKKDEGTKTAPLELLGANACAMSYLEAAYELSSCVTHLVASQISVPFAGWPYDSILERVGKAKDGAALGEMVVERYVNDVSPASDDRVALTLLDLTKAAAVVDALGGLKDALDKTLAEGTAPAGDRLAHVRTAFLATVAGDVRPLVDLVDLCDELTAMSRELRQLDANGPAVRVRAGGPALTTLEKASTTLRGLLQVGTGRFVVAYKAHRDLQALHGVGVFAPFVTTEGDLRRLGMDDDSLERGRKAYTKLAISQLTRWDELVFEKLKLGLPLDVIDCIQTSGASDREDRSAVAQMLASVDSLFARFDRTADAVRATTLSAIKVPASAAAIVGRAGAAPSAGGFGVLELINRKKLARLARKPTAALSVPGRPPRAPSPAAKAQALVAVQSTVPAFLDLERLFRKMEGAIGSTITNGTFGLGPGLLPKIGFGAGPIKTGMGAPIKTGMGAGPIKTGMGEGPIKTGMGAIDGSAFSTLAIPSSPAATVASLFGQVADALLRLELAAAAAEMEAARVMGGALALPGLGPAQVQALAEAALQRAFRTLSDASIDARRTLRRVVAHPAYGFGRGPDNVGRQDRAELARASGLNSERLKLFA